MQRLHKTIADIDIFSPPKIYVEKILQWICDNLGYLFGTVIEIDEEGKGRTFASCNLPEDYVERVNRVKAPVLSSPSGEAIETGRIVVVHNPLSEPRLAPWYEHIRLYNFKTIVWVPLLSKGHAYGTYVLYDTQIRDITEEELQALEQIGVVVSIAISSNQYLDQLTQKTKELEEKIIERKRAEEKLRLFSRAADSSIDGVAMGNLESRITYANDTFVRMFGYSREELIGQEIAFIYAEDQIPKLEEAIKATMEGGWTGELVGKRKDDELFPMMVSSSRVLDNEGKVIATMANHRDISERKLVEKERVALLKGVGETNRKLAERAKELEETRLATLNIAQDLEVAREEAEKTKEELKAKNTELERFTYTVSHDLRSPLVTVRGFVEMLREDFERDEKEKVESDLKFIESSATKMDRLLTDTLQLSRIGRFVNPPEDVPFGEIVQEAQVQTGAQIKSSGVEVSVAEDFPAVHVDRMRIAEVLVNLVTNSINYMGEQSHPKIDIGYRVDGEEPVFFVRDNGIGMDKSQHEKVFELFYKVDMSGKGTGAGLAIVKRIIEVHNGRIWIESEKGEGCTVCFTLPVA